MTRRPPTSTLFPSTTLSRSGSESATSHTFTANYGDVITCTFTNNRLPRLKLAKTVNPGTDTGTFDLTDPSGTFTNASAGYGDGQDTGLHNVAQGSTAVSEAGHGTTNGADYTSSVSCTSNNGSKGSESGTSHTFTANYGDVITCTFTNNRLPRLKLAKTVNPGTDTGTFDLTDRKSVV